MRIRNKLFLFFGLITLGVLLTIWFACESQFRAMETAAQAEAEHLANVLANQIAQGANGAKSTPMAERNKNLQALVTDFKQRLNYDVVILDHKKTIIADADAQNLLKYYLQDGHDETGRTIRDGHTRTFVEAGQGTSGTGLIRKIVVPLKKESGGIAGALVFDYTKIYENHVQYLRPNTFSYALLGLICLLLAALFTSMGNRTIGRPIGELKAGVESLTREGLGVKIEGVPEGELGQLTVAFNRMSQALKDSQDSLVARVGELEQTKEEITLLGKMGDDLQGCRLGDEAFGVISRTLGELFHGDSGALFVFKKSQNLLEAAGTWGEAPPAERVFSPQDCCGMRRGQVCASSDVPGYLRCKHVHESGRGCLCMPVTTQYEELGLLQVLSAPNLESHGDWLKSRTKVIEHAAERLGLVLASLKMNEELRNQSLRDPLTGMYNRRYMEESLERELFRASRHGTTLAVIMLDLDRFKGFNDSYGHIAGDILLREVGLFLQRNVRGSDIACRYGGEEFTLILPDTTLEVALERAEQIREDAKRLKVWHVYRWLKSITLSLGVAVFPDHGTTTKGVLQAADAALYQAKQGGRDQVRVAENIVGLAAKKTDREMPLAGAANSN